MSDRGLEIYKAHVAGLDKYTYFLLAAAGAAMGFALTQTKDAALTWRQLPLGFAMLAWALSFFSGCRHLNFTSSVMRLNAQIFAVRQGRDPMAGTNPQLIEMATEIASEQLNKLADRGGFWSRTQFFALVTGAGFYLVWHVIGMYLRRV